MPLLVLFSTIVCIAIAFSANLVSESSINSFLAYILQEVRFVLAYPVIVSVGCIVLLVILVTSYRVGRRFSFSKKILFSVFHGAAIIGTGFFLSYIIVLSIAFIQINSTAMIANNNPQILGITTNRQTIISSIASNDSPPTIIPTSANGDNKTIAIAVAATGTTNFYGAHMLQSIPHFLIIPIQESMSMLLLDNSLIIAKIDSADLQAIGPVVGFSLIKQYFPSRNIRANPTFRIMEKQEYLSYRKKDTAAKILSIDKEIQTIEGYISSQSATTYENKLQRDTQYNDCIIQKKSKTFCTDVVSKLDQTIAQKDEEKAELQTYYLEVFKQQKVALQQSNGNLPHELGVFEPENSIKIVLNIDSPEAIADYFETVTHEYLHYASYQNKERKFDDVFFEEGLTEYFSRQAVQYSLHTQTNIGYPLYVKIISEMSTMIPDSELADMYFSKDEEALEQALDRVYGEYFYEKNHQLFTSLPFASDTKQQLTIANAIMKKIGGARLGEKDLVSTNSHL